MCSRLCSQILRLSGILITPWKCLIPSLQNTISYCTLCKLCAWNLLSKVDLWVIWISTQWIMDITYYITQLKIYSMCAWSIHPLAKLLCQCIPVWNLFQSRWYLILHHVIYLNTTWIPKTPKLPFFEPLYLFPHLSCPDFVPHGTWSQPLFFTNTQIYPTPHFKWKCLIHFWT